VESVAHPIAGFNPLKKILKYRMTTSSLVIVGRPEDPADLSKDHQKVEPGERERKPLHDVMAGNRLNI